MSTTIPASAASVRPRAVSAWSESLNLNRDSLHVVFGTGQVGLAVTARLAELGLPVRAVSRHRPAGLGDAVRWCAANVLDADASLEAVKGAAVIYQCLNAPYTKWPEMFPPLQRNVLRAAEQTGGYRRCAALSDAACHVPRGARLNSYQRSVAALFGRSKMLHWGATAQELGEALPGDSLVPLPHLQSTRIP